MHTGVEGAIILINAFLLLISCVVNARATWRALGWLQPLYLAITIISGFMACSFTWLFFNPEHAWHWTMFMRGVFPITVITVFISPALLATKIALQRQQDLTTLKQGLEGLAEAREVEKRRRRDWEETH